MRTRLTVAAAAILLSGPAYAGGWLGDAFRPLGESIGAALDKANRDTGKAIEKAAQDTGHGIDKGVGKPVVDAKALVHALTAKSDEDLISLALSPDPCSDVDCHGVPGDIARQAVGIIRSQKQDIVVLEFRRSQAWAAVFSAAISCLSLLISLASFVRAGRRVPTR